VAISKFDDFIIVSKDLKEEHTFPSNSLAEFKTLTAPSKIGNLNESDLTLLSSDIIRIIGYFQIITNNYDVFKPWTRKHENVYINCSVFSSNTCSPVFSPSVVVKKIYSLSKICIYQNGIYLVPNSQNYGPDLLLDEKLLPNKFCSQNKSRASSCFPFAASYSLNFTVPSSRFSGLLSILI